MEEMLEEIDWQEDFMRRMESAESMRSRYLFPTSCRSSSFFSWIWFLVVASTMRISEMGFDLKRDSASLPATAMPPRSSAAAEPLAGTIMPPCSSDTLFCSTNSLGGGKKCFYSKRKTEDKYIKFKNSHTEFAHR